MLPSTSPPQTNKCLPPPPPMMFVEWEDKGAQVQHKHQLPLLPDMPRGNDDNNRRFALPSKEMVRKLQHRPSKGMLPPMEEDEEMDAPAPPSAVTPMAPSSRHPLPVSASLEILKPRPSKRLRRRVLDFNETKSPLLMLTSTSNKGPITTPVS